LGTFGDPADLIVCDTVIDKALRLNPRRLFHFPLIVRPLHCGVAQPE
jgi:hypothetical protein